MSAPPLQATSTWRVAPVGGTSGAPAGGTCAHCGSEFVPERPGAVYCSPGCATVHARIVAAGLGQFYALKDRSSAPPGRGVFEPRDRGWLDDAMRRAEEGGAPTPELEVEVQGLVCIGCVWLLETLFARRSGGIRLEANPARGRLWLRWHRGEFDVPGFAAELQEFGFLVGPVAAGAAAAPASRGLRMRVGLCAAFALNTMLFVLPGYFGLERTSEFHPLFEAAAAMFATAALLTGGSYFARRACAGWRCGIINLDTPITVGLVLGEAGSLYGWWSGQPHLVYFDFVALFSFLMLVGRWTQEAAVERNRAQLLQQSREPEEVELLEGASVRRSAVGELARGARYRLRAGQVVPVASRLVSAVATVTTEWINGEPEPRELRGDQSVPAGATSVGRAPIDLVAEETWSESALARLLATGSRQDFRNPALEGIIRVYLLAILAIAVLGGAVWWRLAGPLPAVHVTLAVLVASCPCGIGLAWPLVEELAVASARRHGVFVRELSVFPRLRAVRKILFDKTGTLTLETPRLVNFGALETLTPVARRRLAQLVRGNHHPVARALQEALAWASPEGGTGNHDTAGAGEGNLEDSREANRGSPADSEADWEEIVGEGVRWRAPDGVWTLGRERLASAAGPAEGPDRDSATVFSRDGEVLARFEFNEAARGDAAVELAALAAARRELFVLSGDAVPRVRALAARLGIPADHAQGGMSPAAKASWIEALDRDDTLMLGDGANDSLAFDAAFVRGTPVIHRGVLGAKSDFHYLGRGLRGIRELFAIAERRRRVLRVLFAFGVSYNVLALALALTGNVNPIVAAVLMPVSSLLSLGIAIGGMRKTAS